MGRFKDFDEAAKTKEPISFKIGGKNYQLPADPPAKKLLAIMRDGIQGIGTPEKALGLLLGEDKVEQILDSGVGILGLNDLVDWVMEQYDIKPTEADRAEAEALTKQIFGDSASIDPALAPVGAANNGADAANPI